MNYNGKEIDLSHLNIDYDTLKRLGFKKGTAYGILRGQVSKKSLQILIDAGLIDEIKGSKVEVDNSLYGEYIGIITNKDILVEGDHYKIKLFIDVNGRVLSYILDSSDILYLRGTSDIGILNAKRIIVKIVGDKVNLIEIRG